MSAPLLCPNPQCKKSFSVSISDGSQPTHCPSCGTAFAQSSLSNESTSETPPGAIAPTLTVQRTTRLQPGALFADRYRVEAHLGRGGMADVYLAHDASLGRSVAIKVPDLGPAAGPDVLRRFQREARMAARLDHPNICPVYDVGLVDGTPYLTMAYIEGQPLAALLRTGPMSPAQAVELAQTIARAMADAHHRGILHRDLKPENIMITPKRGPVIMDFGLARWKASQDSFATQPGSVVGTVGYMSPEQVRGELDEIGPAIDVYSLGAILYRLVAGQLPFRGPAESILYQTVHVEPKPPSTLVPSLDRKLDAICLKALAKQPEFRFHTMTELADALVDWERGPALSSETGDWEGRNAEPIPPTIAVHSSHASATLAASRPSWRPTTPRALRKQRRSPTRIAAGITGFVLFACSVFGLARLFVPRTAPRANLLNESIAEKVTPREAKKRIVSGPPEVPETQPQQTTDIAPSQVPSEKHGKVNVSGPKFAEVLELKASTLDVPGSISVAPLLSAPEPPRWRRLIDEAREHLRRGEYPAAISATNDALREDPESIAPVFSLRGRARLHANQQHDALADLNEAIRLDPDDAEALAARAFIQWLRWYRPELDTVALRDAEHALHVAPQHALARAVRGGVYADNLNFERAFPDIEEALRTDAESAYCHVVRGSAYTSRGAARQLPDDFDRALADYRIASELATEDAIVYINRGNTYSFKKDYDSAIADYSRAIYLDPKYAYAYAYRGSAHERKGELDTAITNFDQAIQLGPNFALAYNYRALAFQKKKDNGHAIDDFTRAVELDPNYALAYQNRGNSYFAQRNFDRAIEDYTRVLEIDPTSVTVFESRARAYRSKGDARSAAADETMASRLREKPSK